MNKILWPYPILWDFQYHFFVKKPKIIKIVKLSYLSNFLSIWAIIIKQDPSRMWLMSLDVIINMFFSNRLLIFAIQWRKMSKNRPKTLHFLFKMTNYDQYFFIKVVKSPTLPPKRLLLYYTMLRNSNNYISGFYHHAIEKNRRFLSKMRILSNFRFWIFFVTNWLIFFLRINIFQWNKK